MPLEDHAIFDPTSLRADPVELLERQGPSRVDELLPIRYGRMVTSPFAFYRGAALVMAADLATTPNSGLQVQLCGDAHISNFGFYASPERNLVFDLNDFDETLPGPFEWDVKRLGGQRGDRRPQPIVPSQGGSEPQCWPVRAGTAKRCAKFAEMPNLAVWYSRLDAERFLSELRGEITPNGSAGPRR